MLLLLVGAASMAVVVSLALTWMVRYTARKYGWVTGPISRRHVHTVPVPRLGGIAVFITAALTIVSLLGDSISHKFLLGTLVPAAWMFAVGLTDDIYGLRANWKLAGQIIGGVSVFCLGLRIPAPFLPEGGGFSWVFSFALTVTWTVAVMNAINLIDGLDGLACGSTLCIVTAAMALALAGGEWGTATIAAVTAGTIAGFLVFNAHPATIFLGDSGSLVLGALTASLTIQLIAATSTGWLACLLLMAHPFGEMVLSTSRRFLRADPIFKPDRRHLHHRLLDRGLGHAHASIVLVLASFLGCLLGVFTAFGGYASVVSPLIAVAGVSLAMVELRYGEFSHLGRWLRSVPSQREVISAHMRLEELRNAIAAARSLTELRITLSEGLVGIGFDNARLKIRSYDSSTLNGPATGNSVGMSFPLYSPESKLGTLELSWNLRAARWPFDPEFFTRDFLPELSRKLEEFAHVYRELPRQVRPARLVVPEILPSIAAESSTLTRVPLNS